MIQTSKAQNTVYIGIEEREKYEWELNLHVNSWEQWFADNMTDWFVSLFNHDPLSNLSKFHADWSSNSTVPQAFYSKRILSILSENTSQIVSAGDFITDNITYTPATVTSEIRLSDSQEALSTLNETTLIANDTDNFAKQSLYGGLATNPYWLLTVSLGPNNINWTKFSNLIQWGLENYWGGWIANTSVNATLNGYSLTVPINGYVNNSRPITINVTYNSGGILQYNSFEYGNQILYELVFGSFTPRPATGWENFLKLISYPPGSTIFIFLLSLATTVLSTLLTRWLSDPKQLQEKQNIIKEHQSRRNEIEDLKEENPKKYKKELAKWERMDKPIQAMQQKMGLQRMKPMLFTCIPYMIIFPIIAGFFRSATGNSPVAIPPMNPWDIPLLGGMMHASTELIPIQAGLINYTTWYILCSFTCNTIIGRLAGTYQGGGFGQMFDQAKYDSYKT
jgi:uncharacterized membrane protein (DUF106 family)